MTKKAIDIEKPQLTLGVGNGNRKTLNFATGQASDHWNYALNINALDTEGMDEQVAQDGLSNTGLTYDWEKRYDIGFNGEIYDFKLNAKLIQREAGPYIGIASVLNDETKQDYLEYFIEAIYEKEFNKNISFSTKIYFDHFEANNYWEIYPEGFGAGAFPDGFIGSPTVKNDKIGSEIQAIVKLAHGNKLLGGVSFEHQAQYDVKHYTNFDPNTGAPLGSYQNVSNGLNWNSSNRRDVSAVYLQNISDLNDDLRLILGVRNDHYSDFGDSLSPRSSLSWSITPSSTVTVLYGQAFRAPNFGELYNINTPVIKGNPNLDPEEIETFEASIDFQLSKRQSVKATAFKNNISNIIGYTGGVASNNGNLKTNGMEVEFDARFTSGSNFNANYTYQYPENTITSSRAPDIPLHQINASYTYRHSRYLSAYIGSEYRSSLGRKIGDTRSDVNDQTTFNMAINWKNEKETLDVKASIYNLLDENLYDAAVEGSPAFTVQSDFPSAGRSFELSATVSL